MISKTLDIKELKNFKNIETLEAAMKRKYDKYEENYIYKLNNLYDSINVVYNMYLLFSFTLTGILIGCELIDLIKIVYIIAGICTLLYLGVTMPLLQEISTLKWMKRKYVKDIYRDMIETYTLFHDISDDEKCSLLIKFGRYARLI